MAIIDAVVRTRSDRVKSLIEQYSDTIIDRVKERVDDVKIEIMNTLGAIIKALFETTRAQSIERDLMHHTSIVRMASVGEQLKSKQAKITKVLVKQMKSKNKKVKVAAIDTLSIFTNLTQFLMDKQFNDFWPELSKTIDDRSCFEPTLSALSVLRRLFRARDLKSTQPAIFATHADAITAFLKKAIEHEYSKVVYEGLRVSSSFLNALRNSATGTVDPAYSKSVN